MFSLGATLIWVSACGAFSGPDPCDRRIPMRNTLEYTTGRDCDLISDHDLAGLGTLDFKNFNTSELKKSDFAGLDNVSHLRMGEFDRQVLEFVGLKNIEALGWRSGFPARADFEGLTNLRRISVGYRSSRPDPTCHGLTSTSAMEYMLTESLAELPSLRELIVLLPRYQYRFSDPDRADEITDTIALVERFARRGVKLTATLCN